MTKKDIARAIAARTGTTIPTAETIIDALSSTVKQALACGHRVDFRGFGSFRPVAKSARIRQNFWTGESMVQPAETVPVFKPAPVFVEKVKLIKV